MVVMTANRPVHVPVMLEECLELLDVREGGSYIDATTGLGGHSEAIAGRIGPSGRLLCIDQDGEALEFARARLTPFGRRVSFARGNFRDIDRLAADAGFAQVDGVLMDLGISSFQLDTASRGFAFGQEGPLDMRMDPSSGGVTAGDILNTWTESSLADLFYQYGEERKSRRLARVIVESRPLTTTWELAKAAEQAVGGVRGRTQIHPATRAFLALRIFVNSELDSLDEVLPRAHGLLGSFGSEAMTGARHGGRLVVISFHSLEDRKVKHYLRREATGCLCPPSIPVCRCGHVATLRLITRALRPSEEEVARNPRARSAVVRAAERISN